MIEPLQTLYSTHYSTVLCVAKDLSLLITIYAVAELLATSTSRFNSDNPHFITGDLSRQFALNLFTQLNVSKYPYMISRVGVVTLKTIIM